MQKAIIIGATSGIGQEVARILVQQGWHIGIAGRRRKRHCMLCKTTAPDRIVTVTTGRYGRDRAPTPP